MTPAGRLKDIKVPTLIYCGDDDHFVVRRYVHRSGAEYIG